MLSWGGTYGACYTAVKQAQAEGLAVTHAHLRYIHPFPKNLKTVLGNFKKVLIPELNLGQLRHLVRNEFLIDAAGLNKVQGKPFAVHEIVSAIKAELK